MERGPFTSPNLPCLLLHAAVQPAAEWKGAAVARDPWAPVEFDAIAGLQLQKPLVVPPADLLAKHSMPVVPEDVMKAFMAPRREVCRDAGGGGVQLAAWCGVSFSAGLAAKALHWACSRTAILVPFWTEPCPRLSTLDPAPKV